MSSDYDIVMGLDETLELDTIVEKSNKASNPITRFEHISDGTEHENELNNIQTHTSVFNPSKSGEYEIDINGQNLSLKVRDKTDTLQNSSFESGNLSSWKTFGNASYSVSTNQSYEGSYSLSLSSDKQERGFVNTTYKFSPPLTVEWYQYFPSGVGSSYDIQYIYGYQDSDNFYAYAPRNIFGSNYWFKKQNGSYSQLDENEASNDANTGEWYKVTVKWNVDGTHSAEIVRVSDGSTKQTNSITDTTFTSEGYVGVGYYPSTGQGNSYVDSINIVSN
jgi:hypothetical protein